MITQRNVTKPDQFTKQDLELIQTALTQRIEAFEEHKKICRVDGKVRPADAWVANYLTI